MKKFLTVLLTIVTTLTALVTIFLFIFSHFTKEEVTGKIIDKIPIEKAISEMKDTPSMNRIYEEAKSFGIEQQKVDEILSNDEIKAYFNDLLQLYLQNNLGNGNEKNLETITKDFIAKANEKYSLNLSQAKQLELTQITTDTIDRKTTGKLEIESEIKWSPFVSITLSNTTKNICLAILLLELLFLTMLTFKKKNFFAYYSIISLCQTIILFLITGASHIILNIALQEEKKLLPLFQSFLQEGYLLGLIFLVLTILFFVIHNMIQKKVELKEVVPF